MGLAQTATFDDGFLPDFLTRTQKKRLKRQVRQERSEKAQEKRRIPKYILLLVGLFLLAIVIYMLASWQG